MSPDRVVYSFILGWVVLIAVVIVLDWLGNPNRGGFRPKGERQPRDRSARKSERRRHRLENDAAVRAALRDAYGASSLRLTWSGAQEDRSRQVDDALVVTEPADNVLDAASHEVVPMDHTAVFGDALPNLEEVPPDQPEIAASTDVETDDDRHADAPTTGWSQGGDPLALTGRGTVPVPTTIRRRVWKNHAVTGSWDTENLARLRAGRPPLRTNPITGRIERATADAETGRASWGGEPLDPFGPTT